jgi:hypothetical protein
MVVTDVVIEDPLALDSPEQHDLQQGAYTDVEWIPLGRRVVPRVYQST